MPRTTQELRQDLDLVEKAEEILNKIMDHEVQLDDSWPELKPLPQDATSAQSAEQATSQGERRRTQMQPRASAVAPFLAELLGLWRSRLRRLARRHVGMHRPLDTAIGRWRCSAAAAWIDVVDGYAIHCICRWGCTGCCDAALSDLRNIREGVRRELATAASTDEPVVTLSPKDRARVYDEAGKLLPNARKFLRGLPAKTLVDVAARAGLSLNTVKKISVPMKQANLVRKDRHRGYMRVNESAGT